MARMSPNAQSTARQNLSSQMKNVETGDADMDSMLAKEVGRRAQFGLAEASKQPHVPHPGSNKNVFSALGKMFNSVFKGKKK